MKRTSLTLLITGSVSVIIGVVIGVFIVQQKYVIGSVSDISAVLIQALTAFIAFVALRQISISIESHQLTKQKVSVDVLEKFQELLVNFEVMRTKRKLLGFSEICFMLNDFRFEEIEGNVQLKKYNDYCIGFYKIHEDQYKDLVSAANKLEVISMMFTKNVADLDIVQDSVAFAFCFFVESNTSVYLQNRNDKMLLYRETIEIYKILKPISLLKSR